MTLFGNRVFAHRIQWRWVRTGGERALNPMPGVLRRRKKFGYRDTGDTEGEGDEKIPAVLDQHKLEPKDTEEFWQPPEASGKKGIFSGVFGKNTGPIDPSIPDF